MNEAWAEIGARVGEIRIKKRFTFADMGDFLNLSALKYQKMEEGKTCFSLEHIMTMCRLFRVSHDWLLTGQPGGLEWSKALEKLCTDPTFVQKSASKE